MPGKNVHTHKKKITDIITLVQSAIKLKPVQIHVWYKNILTGICTRIHVSYGHLVDQKKFTVVNCLLEQPPLILCAHGGI